MNRSDDYGRRRRPDQQYGGYEEGYGNVPGDDRNWRRRDLSAGRHGNTNERNPYDAYDDGDDRDGRGRGGNPRDDDAWRRGRTAQLSGGWRSRGAAVYYPGRTSYDESRGESTPHSPGYVSAYSSGYEDGYHAGAHTANAPLPRPEERERRGGQAWRGGRGQHDQYGDRDDRDDREQRWQGTRTGTGSGYEDYGVTSGRNFRQRPRPGEAVQGRGPYAYGNARPNGPKSGPKNYTRSDERIREEVCERLSHAQTVDVSDVTVAVSGGVVTLTGTVDNRRMKYEVEDIADDTYGVSDVINQIHVRPYGVLASE